MGKVIFTSILLCQLSHCVVGKTVRKFDKNVYYPEKMYNHINNLKEQCIERSEIRSISNGKDEDINKPDTFAYKPAEAYICTYIVGISDTAMSYTTKRALINPLTGHLEVFEVPKHVGGYDIIHCSMHDRGLNKNMHKTTMNAYKNDIRIENKFDKKVIEGIIAYYNRRIKYLFGDLEFNGGLFEYTKEGTRTLFKFAFSP